MAFWMFSAVLACLNLFLEVFNTLHVQEHVFGVFREGFHFELIFSAVVGDELT